MISDGHSLCLRNQCLPDQFPSINRYANEFRVLLQLFIDIFLDVHNCFWSHQVDEGILSEWTASQILRSGRLVNNSCSDVHSLLCTLERKVQRTFHSEHSSNPSPKSRTSSRVFTTSMKQVIRSFVVGRRVPELLRS
jgi:hypothetical protein